MRRLVSLVFIAAVCAGTPAAAHAQASTGDQWLRRPVDARTFATFLDFFTYDRALPLETVRGDSADLGGVRRVHERRGFR